MPALPRQFAATLALVRAGDPDGAAWAELERRYSEAHRHVHTLAYLTFCLDRLAESGHDRPDLRLAVFYHKSICDPCSETNEVQSARFAREQLDALGVPKGVLASVYDLIRSLDPLPSPPGSDADLIGDLTLAILGTEPETYQAYAEALRREYSWLPDSRYGRSRMRTLLEFFERPALYRTPFFRERYEAQARENIAAEVARLRGDRPPHHA